MPILFTAKNRELFKSEIERSIAPKIMKLIDKVDGRVDNLERKNIMAAKPLEIQGKHQVLKLNRLKLENLELRHQFLQMMMSLSMIIVVSMADNERRIKQGNSEKAATNYNNINSS